MRSRIGEWDLVSKVQQFIQRAVGFLFRTFSCLFFNVIVEINKKVDLFLTFELFSVEYHQYSKGLACALIKGGPLFSQMR